MMIMMMENNHDLLTCWLAPQVKKSTNIVDVIYESPLIFPQQIGSAMSFSSSCRTHMHV